MKNIIDDGYNAELVMDAVFDGKLEIPTIRKPQKIIIPKNLVPFSKRNYSQNHSDFLCFYEHDVHFLGFVNSPQKYLSELKKFQGIISPDCSLYFDMPLVLQMMNVYRNRQIGHYLQTQGFYVIPNVRWGDERSFKRENSNEVPFAFLGIEKHSIVSIGTYGCVKGKENSRIFIEGLLSMLKELEPQIVLVYGSMPKNIFEDLLNSELFVRFIQYDDWTTLKHKTSKGDFARRIS